jgi:hypothetical protein
MIQKIPELNTDEFKSLLIARIKDASLRAFLCRSARTYDSFSILSLSENFELPKA